jgi:hypothetical protein
MVPSMNWSSLCENRRRSTLNGIFAVTSSAEMKFKRVVLSWFLHFRLHVFIAKWEVQIFLCRMSDEVICARVLRAEINKLKLAGRGLSMITRLCSEREPSLG